MSRRKLKFFSYSKMIVPAVAAAGVVTLSTMNACSPSDRSTAAREEVIAQNALDAERAEEQMSKEGDHQADKHEAKHDGSEKHGTKKADKQAAQPTDKKAGHGDNKTVKSDHKTAKATVHGNETVSATHLAENELKHGAAKTAKADAHGTADASSPTTVSGHDDGHGATPGTAHAAAAGATHSATVRQPASAMGAAYVVQVGAFRVRENAQKLQSKLQEAGYKVELQTVEHSKNGLLHLVRFEPTTNKSEAETMVEDLHAKHELSALILNAH